jgi:hypothetical protein
MTIEAFAKIPYRWWLALIIYSFAYFWCSIPWLMIIKRLLVNDGFFGEKIQYIIQNQPLQEHP